MPGDPGAPGTAPEMSGDGQLLKLIVKNSFLEVVDVGSGLRRAQSDSDLWSSSGGCPSWGDDDASLAPSRDAGTASASLQESFVDGYGSRGGFVDEDSNRRTRRRGGRSSSSRSGSAAHQEKHAGLTVVVVNDRDAGSDLEGRGKRDEDSGQAEPAKLEWSRGTVRHTTGNCKPCLYHNARAGCTSGVNCKFCHAPHVRKHRARPSKATRLQCKRLAEMCDNVGGQQDNEASARPSDTDACFAAMGIMCASEQKYMRSILTARSRQPSGQQAAAVCDRRPANAGAWAGAGPERASGSR